GVGVSVGSRVCRRVFFFFASRRRHTRLVSDWSSDVCSSDLLEKPFGGRGLLLGAVPGVAPGGVVILGGGIVGYNAAIIALGLGRSEERRVGEEWRSRGAARALKTKGGRSAGMRTADGRQGDD